MSELLTIENRGGVRLLTLNRPEKKNAINNALWCGIRDAFREADADPGVRCLVLAGAGGNFSAGVDLSSFSEPGEGEHPFGECARTVADFGKPWTCVHACAFRCEQPVHTARNGITSCGQYQHVILDELFDDG